MNQDWLKTTAIGAGLGAAGAVGATATGLGMLGMTVAGAALPPVAAGAVVGGLVGLAYGMGKRN